MDCPNLEFSENYSIFKYILTWSSLCPDDWTMRLAMAARRSSRREKAPWPPPAIPRDLAPSLKASLDIWITEN